MQIEPSDIKDIMLCLGEIKGTLVAQEKANTRITIALIGLIAAQIGVKILGTPILLDIATALAIVGVILMLGFLILGWRMRKAYLTLTRTGKALSVMIMFIAVTQMCVYFRDLGWIMTPDTVYAVRILQNLSVLVFIWQLYTERHIYYEKDKAIKEGIDGKH